MGDNATWRVGPMEHNIAPPQQKSITVYSGGPVPGCPVTIYVCQGAWEPRVVLDRYLHKIARIVANALTAENVQ